MATDHETPPARTCAGLTRRGAASLAEGMKRMRETLDLHDLGVAMYRQRMRNENPQATESEVEAMVQAWLLERPHDPTLTPPPRRPSRKPPADEEGERR